MEAACGRLIEALVHNAALPTRPGAPSVVDRYILQTGVPVVVRLKRKEQPAAHQLMADNKTRTSRVGCRTAVEEIRRGLLRVQDECRLTRNIQIYDVPYGATQSFK